MHWNVLLWAKSAVYMGLHIYLLFPFTERKKKKRQTEEEVERQYQEWTGMDFASSTRAAENRSRWKGIVANSSVVPRRTPKVMG